MTTENEAKPRRRARPAGQAEGAPGDEPTTSAVTVAPGAVGSMAAIPSIEGQTVAIDKSAVGGVRAGSVTVEQGVVGGALAGSVTVRQSFARTVLAQRVEIGQSLVRSLVANEVHVRPSTNVGLLIARRVEGDVKVLLDWRGAAILGAVAGLVGGLVRSARGRGR